MRDTERGRGERRERSREEDTKGDGEGGEGEDDAPEEVADLRASFSLERVYTLLLKMKRPKLRPMRSSWGLNWEKWSRHVRSYALGTDDKGEEGGGDCGDKRGGDEEADVERHRRRDEGSEAAERRNIDDAKGRGAAGRRRKEGRGERRA